MEMTLGQAVAYAAMSHVDQTTKNGEEAYILHCIRVMLRLDTDKERRVGVLHDIVEDTNVTLDDLRREGLPEDEIEALDVLTCRKGEPYPDFIERVAQNPLAKKVKLADIDDNTDEKRLAKLTPSRAQYFRDKYGPAWGRLTR